MDGLVGGLVQSMGLGQKLKECEALLAWDEVIEPNWKMAAKPKKIENGRLEVWVTGAVRRTQLMFLQQEIIARINARVGQTVVSELVVRNQRP